MIKPQRKFPPARRSFCRSLCRALLLASIVALVTAAAAAQESAHSHHDAQAKVPAELLARPIPIRAGIGSVRDAVTSSSKQAQAFYDQGVACLHSYQWIEAARSFNQALREDAKLAMAYVGLSRAYSGLNDSQAARGALDKASELAPTASAREQRRIALRAEQLQAMAAPSNATLHAQYKKSLDDAIALYPNDVELLLLRGNAEEPSAAGRGQRGAQGAIEFYKQALAASPDHFAAHHYLTHSYENTNQIREALAHGQAYARLAPSVPHARHMYGHNLRRVGRIDEAIAEFARANELEEAYYKSENIPAHYDWHHQHNLDLLSTSYQYVGRMKTAEQLMRKSFSLPSLQDSLEFNKKEWPEFLLARGRNEEALAAASALAQSRWELVRAIGKIMASRALMAMNRLPAASEEAKGALKEAQGAARTVAYVGPYLTVLQGEFFLRTGQVDRGRSILKSAQAKVRAEPGPDAWTQALFQLEAIARAARAVEDWELLEYTARQMLEHDAGYAGTHYLLGLVAERKNDRAAAIEAFTLAEKYWRQADSDLPELLEARAKLAKLRAQPPRPPLPPIR